MIPASGKEAIVAFVLPREGTSFSALVTSLLPNVICDAPNLSIPVSKQKGQSREVYSDLVRRIFGPGSEDQEIQEG